MDQAAVRAYRASLAAPERPSFGLAGLDAGPEAFLVEESFPLARYRATDRRVEILTVAPRGRRGVAQTIAVTAEREVEIAWIWTGEMRLARAAYTQLTPGGPLPPFASRPTAGGDDLHVWVADAELGIAAAVALPRAQRIAAGTTSRVAAAIAFAPTADEAVAEADALAGDAERNADEAVGKRRSLWAGADVAGEPAVERRATAYALDCAACDVDRSATAILADHVILPLVWTRDAYYVCRALLATAPGPGAAVTARFLRWCFERAERPGGWWPRASLASGAAKDPAFQLDQQLYPLLLLEDHARLTGDDALVRRHAAARDDVIRRLLDRRASFGLVATAETPADDPIAAPYHFSSHVLLWRVLRDLDPAAASDLRAAMRRHFASGPLFAYAIRGADGDGAHRYHDANDLPTVFAPGWGFCTAADPRWRSTIDFAWSQANQGFVEGPLGGLGSVHTLHPWPLGDLQELVVARVQGDAARAARARARLLTVRTWDGLLPEAYDERTGAVASRHWFAWPTALWALLERDEERIAP